MSGLEVVGVIASLLQVAAAGTALAKSLQAMKDAKPRMALIAAEVNSLSTTCRNLSTVFEQEQVDQVCSADALRDAQQIATDSERVFSVLKVVSQRYLRERGDGQTVIGKRGLIRWGFGKGRLEGLVATLKSHQGCAHAMVSVLTHARMVKLQQDQAKNISMPIVSMHVQTPILATAAPRPEHESEQALVKSELTGADLDLLRQYKAMVERLLADLGFAEKVIDYGGSISSVPIFQSTMLVRECADVFIRARSNSDVPVNSVDLGPQDVDSHVDEGDTFWESFDSSNTNRFLIESSLYEEMLHGWPLQAPPSDIEQVAAGTKATSGREGHAAIMRPRFEDSACSKRKFSDITIETHRQEEPVGRIQGVSIASPGPTAVSNDADVAEDQDLKVDDELASLIDEVSGRTLGVAELTYEEKMARWVSDNGSAPVVV